MTSRAKSRDYPSHITLDDDIIERCSSVDQTILLCVLTDFCKYPKTMSLITMHQQNIREKLLLKEKNIVFAFPVRN